MQIIQDDAKKLVQVWLARSESEDAAVQAKLNPMYNQWKKKKYKVAVFHSGNGDVQQDILALLMYNKKRSAQLQVQREKARSTASHERGGRTVQPER